MVDFLLVHDIGQGAWAWGKVWGYLTGPVEHPPRLAVVTAAGRVVSPDLPYHPTAGLDAWVTSVTEAISSHGLRDLVLVAHGVSAPVALQVAVQLETPPKRVVLLAGVLPKDGKSPLSTLPLPFRLALKNPLARGNTKIPKALITYYLCNNMDPMDIIQIVGRFMPVPAALLRSRLSVSSFCCPVLRYLRRPLERPTALTRAPTCHGRQVGRGGGGGAQLLPPGNRRAPQRDSRSSFALRLTGKRAVILLLFCPTSLATMI